MIAYIVFIIFSYFTYLLSNVWWVRQYADFLLEMYGNPLKEKYLKKHPELRPSWWKRPFRPGYKQRYPNDAKRYYRFLCMLYLSRFNTLSYFIVLIITIIALPFGIMTFDDCINLLTYKLAFADVPCFLVGLPFGLMTFGLWGDESNWLP